MVTIALNEKASANTMTIPSLREIVHAMLTGSARPAPFALFIGGV